jgi:hypothetical protein
MFPTVGHSCRSSAPRCQGLPSGKQLCTRDWRKFGAGRIRNAYEESEISQRLYFLFGKHRKISSPGMPAEFEHELQVELHVNP